MASTLQGNELLDVTGLLPSGGPAAVKEPTTSKAIASVGGAVTTQTGTAYTFKASDVGGYTRMNNAGAITLTIDNETNTPMPPDAVLTWEQTGAGVVTVTAAAGVTLLSAGSKVATNGQGAVCSAKRTLQNHWTVFGNLA